MVLSYPKSIDREKIKAYAPLIISAFIITLAAIVFKQNFVRTLPLYVSLFVGMLQARASRFSYLVGGLNCVLYTVVYISLGLYASAASALLFSCPIQLITFVSWSKHSYKHSTEFKSLSTFKWLLIGIVFSVGFVIVNFVLSATYSSYRFLDNSASILGLIVSLLSMLSYREYSWLMLVTGSLNIVLYLNMSFDNPAQITFLIYGMYSMFCIIRQFFSVQKLYTEQKNAEEI